MDKRDIKLKSSLIRKSLPIVQPAGPPDIKVRCVDGVVKCHQELLANISPYFYGMDPGVSAICIPHVSVDIFTSVLNFHLTGECTVARRNLDAMLRFSKQFKLDVFQAAIEKVANSEAGAVFTVEEFNVDDPSSESELDDEKVEEEEEEEDSQWLDDDYEDTEDTTGCTRHAGSKSSPHSHVRWKKEEVKALKEIWSNFWITTGRRLDIKAITAAMADQGFKRRTEQIRKKIKHLKLKEQFNRQTNRRKH